MPRHYSDSDVEKAAGLPRPGQYEAVVDVCELRRSRAGDEMYQLEIRLLDEGVTVRDWIMLEGKGLDMGLKKLAQFGAARRKGDGWEVDDADEVKGRRLRVTIAHETYDGRAQCRVDRDAPGLGYQSSKGSGGSQQAPATHYTGVEEPAADDMPF